MKILIEINHPAHFHFLKHAIRIFQKKNYNLLIIVREKDIVRTLIKDFNIQNIYYFKKIDTFFKKVISILTITKDLFKIALKFKPDLFLGWNSIYSGVVSKILRKPFILFEDNEYNWSQLVFRIPFATLILTNSTFPQNFGKRHIYYNSYEELAYLHPNRFKINKELKKKYHIPESKKLLVLRLIAWNSTHDHGHHGLFRSKKDIILFIKKLKDYGIVLLSVEGNNPVLLLNDRFSRIDPNDFLDLLGLADIYIGEGGTIAAEAACLGTPAIYTSTLIRSYIEELSNKYNLIYISTSKNEVLKKTEEYLFNEEIKNSVKINWRKMINEKIDLTQLIIYIVDKYYCE